MIEQFGNTKGVIIKGKSEKYRQYNGQKKREKDKQWSTKQGILKIEDHKTAATEWLAVPVPLVASVYCQTIWTLCGMWYVN